MVTTQAQALAKLGVGTLVIDLYGTGESDGEHGDARWNLWRDNVRQGIEWLDAQAGGCIALLGIRLGVPLAMSVLEQDRKTRALIAWQAVVDGKTYFTQFMRTRIAANMDRTDIPKETTAGMRAQLAEGKSIEVSGYEIHPELAMAIEAVRLGEMIPPESAPITWLEKAGGEERTLSPASEKTLAAWQLAGRSSEIIPFEGPAFWALYDRFLAHDLVQKTSDRIQRMRPEK